MRRRRPVRHEDGTWYCQEEQFPNHTRAVNIVQCKVPFELGPIKLTSHLTKAKAFCFFVNRAGSTLLFRTTT